MGNETKRTVLVLDQPTPTLFVDYDGTLHRWERCPRPEWRRVTGFRQTAV